MLYNVAEVVQEAPTSCYRSRHWHFAACIDTVHDRWNEEGRGFDQKHLIGRHRRLQRGDRFFYGFWIFLFRQEASRRL